MSEMPPTAEPKSAGRPNKSLSRSIIGLAGALAVLAGAVAAGGAGLAAIYAAAEGGDALTPTPPLPVQVATLERIDAYETKEVFVGRVEAARTSAVGFEAGGELAEILVEEGDTVRKGQQLARLDIRAVSARKEQLMAEKAQVEAELALAERTRARQEQLSGEGYASEQRADEARTSETTAKASIAALDAQLRMVEIDLEKAVLLAPFDGVIAERFVDPGVILAPGQTVLRVLEAGRPQARIGLPPERAEALTLGDRYTLEIRGRGAEATLVAIRPDVDTLTRTVPALFDLDLSSASATPVAASVAPGADPLTAPFGELARLTLPLEVEQGGAWTPLAALQEDAKGLWRLLIVETDAEGVARIASESVEIVYISDEKAFIRGPFDDGAQYVASGVNRVAIGQSVEPLAQAD